MFNYKCIFLKLNCRPLENLSVEGLVRLWAHEALRLFQDRLVDESERRWTNENIDMVAIKHFPTADKEVALIRPILYSNWLSKDYVPVDRQELKEYVKARLKVKEKSILLEIRCLPSCEKLTYFVRRYFMTKSWMFHWCYSMRCSITFCV